MGLNEQNTLHIIFKVVEPITLFTEITGLVQKKEN